MLWSMAVPLCRANEETQAWLTSGYLLMTIIDGQLKNSLEINLLVSVAVN